MNSFQSGLRAAWISLIACSMTAASRAQNVQLGTPFTSESQSAIAQAQDRIAARNWYNVRLFPQQTFPLSIDGHPAGLLVSGTGRHHKGDEDKCFLTLLEPGRTPAILSTSSPDEGMNNTIHCGGVRALGLLPSHTSAQVRIGILYFIDLPIQGHPNQHLDNTLAVVVTFDPARRTFTIDQAATDKAQAASPENLPALQQALAH